MWLSIFNPHSSSVSYYYPHFTGEARDILLSVPLLINDKDRALARQSDIRTESQRAHSGDHAYVLEVQGTRDWQSPLCGLVAGNSFL